MNTLKASKSVVIGVSAFIFVALLVAACGGGTTPTPNAAPPTATTAPAEPAATTPTTPMTETTAMTATEMMTETPAMTKTELMTETTEVVTETTVTTKTGVMTETSQATGMVLVAVSDNPTLGQILVDNNGMTLYIFDKDSTDKSNCASDCLKNWPALTVEDGNAAPTPGEGVTGKLGVITRDDGTYQVTVNGMPLYTYAKDTKAGDVVGQAAGEVWWVVSPDGTKNDEQ